jgi:hypothetical protein
MLELIADIGLFFAQPFVMASILIVGFLFRNENMFGRTLFLLLFTMIYNVYLKSIWQMPLPPPLEGFAFPSGHMHSAVVFWGWLAVEYRKIWFSEIIFLLLCFSGYGIVYHGYHYPIDILGAVGFGILSMILYSLLQRLSYFKEKPYRNGFLLSLLGLCILFLLPAEGRKPHVWQALGVLFGFSIGWWLRQRYLLPSFSVKQKMILLLVTFSGGGIILLSSTQLPFATHTVVFIKCLLVAFWVASCKLLITKRTKQV